MQDRCAGLFIESTRNITSVSLLEQFGLFIPWDLFLRGGLHNKNSILWLPDSGSVGWEELALQWPRDYCDFDVHYVLELSSQSIVFLAI